MRWRIATSRSCSAATARASRWRGRGGGGGRGGGPRAGPDAPSQNISIAMFAGGGIAWADAAMKRGEFAVAPAPPGAHPDLSGLSCRYEEIPASRGVVLSLVVAPAPGASGDAFRAAIEHIATLVEKTPDASRPVTGQRLRRTRP